MKGTLTYPSSSPENISLLREGWNVLIEQLGVHKATQFAMLLERGYGDSVQEIAEYWGETSIDDIHAQILAWKDNP